MKILSLSSLVFLLLVAPPGVRAAEEAIPILLAVDDRGQLEELTRLVSIENVDGLSVRAVATPEQLARLAAAGFSWQRLAVPEVSATMCPPGWVEDPDRAWSCYPSYPQYVALLQRYADLYPQLCELVSLGPTTNQVRPHQLLVLRITDDPQAEENEPEVFFTSSMHGDETTGFVLMLRLIDELLTGYGSQPGVTEIVDGFEIWINPLANPDGTYRTSDSDLSGAIRYYTTTAGISSGVDPNRNFPDPDDGDHPDGYPWWLETQHMMAFAEDHSIVLSANFHGGAEVVNYPWDTWSRRHVDDALLIDISRTYAEQAQADAGQNGYMTDLDDGITNGYDWYPVAGGRQDFMTFWHGSRETTIELSHTKLLPASQLPTLWSYNRQALLGYIREADDGVFGEVTDPNGSPLAAVVEVVGLDTPADNSYVATDPAVGDYHRMLLPGTYDLRFSAYGFEPQEHTGVMVTAGPASRVDAVLIPLPSFAVNGEVKAPAPFAPIAGATVEILDTPHATTTAADGTFSFSSVLAGNARFRVAAAGYETIEVERTVSAASFFFPFVLEPLEVRLAADFEIDDGGLVPAGGWEWGAPSGTGNPGAHSGTRVWATDLDGDYPDAVDWYLTLPDLAVPAGASTLSFWHWYSFEVTGGTAYDGGRLEIDDGSGFVPLVPHGGYPEASIVALGGAGYGGTIAGWEEVRCELSPYAGMTVDLRWHLASDGSQTELGWYLDDLLVSAAAEYRADFEVDPTPAASGEPVRFTDRSSGPVLAWWWDFGDGATADEQNPVHSFGSEGTFSVTLTATYADGNRLRSREVVVDDDGIFADDFESGDASRWSL